MVNSIIVKNPQYESKEEDVRGRTKSSFLLASNSVPKQGASFRLLFMKGTIIRSAR